MPETAPVSTSPDGARRWVPRRRFLPRPADQFRTSLVPTVGAAILLVAALAIVHNVNEARTRELAEANPGIADVLSAQLSSMETTLAAVSIVYLIGVLAVGLVHSRRLMGALFAIDRRIRRLGAGDLGTTLRLRRGDYFHDVADGINRTAEAFRRRAQEDLADLDDLISVLDRSPQAGPLREGLRETLEGARERKRQLLGIEAERTPVPPDLLSLAR